MIPVDSGMGVEDWGYKFSASGVNVQDDYLHQQGEQCENERDMNVVSLEEDKDRWKRRKCIGGGQVRLIYKEAESFEDETSPSEIAMIPSRMFLHQQVQEEVLCQKARVEKHCCENELLFKTRMWAKNLLKNPLQHYAAYQEEELARQSAGAKYDSDGSEEFLYSLCSEEEVETDPASITDAIPSKDESCYSRCRDASHNSGHIEKPPFFPNKKNIKGKARNESPEVVSSPEEEPNDKYVDTMDELQNLVETVSEYLAEKEEEINNYESLHKSGKLGNSNQNSAKAGCVQTDKSVIHEDVNKETTAKNKEAETEHGITGVKNVMSSLFNSLTDKLITSKEPDTLEIRPETPNTTSRAESSLSKLFSFIPKSTGATPIAVVPPASQGPLSDKFSLQSLLPFQSSEVSKKLDNDSEASRAGGDAHFKNSSSDRAAESTASQTSSIVDSVFGRLNSLKLLSDKLSTNDEVQSKEEKKIQGITAAKMDAVHQLTCNEGTSGEKSENLDHEYTPNIFNRGGSLLGVRNGSQDENEKESEKESNIQRKETHWTEGSNNAPQESKPKTEIKSARPEEMEETGFFSPLKKTITSLISSAPSEKPTKDTPAPSMFSLFKSAEDIGVENIGEDALPFGGKLKLPFPSDENVSDPYVTKPSGGIIQGLLKFASGEDGSAPNNSGSTPVSSTTKTSHRIPDAVKGQLQNQSTVLESIPRSNAETGWFSNLFKVTVAENHASQSQQVLHDLTCPKQTSPSVQPQMPQEQMPKVGNFMDPREEHVLVESLSIEQKPNTEPQVQMPPHSEQKLQTKPPPQSLLAGLFKLDKDVSITSKSQLNQPQQGSLFSGLFSSSQSGNQVKDLSPLSQSASQQGQMPAQSSGLFSGLFRFASENITGDQKMSFSALSNKAESNKQEFQGQNQTPLNRITVHPSPENPPEQSQASLIQDSLDPVEKLTEHEEHVQNLLGKNSKLSQQCPNQAGSHLTGILKETVQPHPCLQELMDVDQQQQTHQTTSNQPKGMLSGLFNKLASSANVSQQLQEPNETQSCQKEVNKIVTSGQNQSQQKPNEQGGFLSGLFSLGYSDNVSANSPRQQTQTPLSQQETNNQKLQNAVHPQETPSSQPIGMLSGFFSKLTTLENVSQKSRQTSGHHPGLQQENRTRKNQIPFLQGSSQQGGFLSGLFNLTSSDNTSSSQCTPAKHKSEASDIQQQASRQPLQRPIQGNSHQNVAAEPAQGGFLSGFFNKLPGSENVSLQQQSTETSEHSQQTLHTTNVTGKTETTSQHAVSPSQSEKYLSGLFKSASSDNVTTTQSSTQTLPVSSSIQKPSKEDQNVSQKHGTQHPNQQSGLFSVFSKLTTLDNKTQQQEDLSDKQVDSQSSKSVENQNSEQDQGGMISGLFNRLVASIDDAKVKSQTHTGENQQRPHSDSILGHGQPETQRNMQIQCIQETKDKKTNAQQGFMSGLLGQTLMGKASSSELGVPIVPHENTIQKLSSCNSQGMFSSMFKTGHNRSSTSADTLESKEGTVVLEELIPKDNERDPQNTIISSSMAGFISKTSDENVTPSFTQVSYTSDGNEILPSHYSNQLYHPLVPENFSSFRQENYNSIMFSDLSEEYQALCALPNEYKYHDLLYSSADCRAIYGGIREQQFLVDDLWKRLSENSLPDASVTQQQGYHLRDGSLLLETPQWDNLRHLDTDQYYIPSYPRMTAPQSPDQIVFREPVEEIVLYDMTLKKKKRWNSCDDLNTLKSQNIRADYVPALDLTITTGNAKLSRCQSLNECTINNQHDSSLTDHTSKDHGSKDGWPAKRMFDLDKCLKQHLDRRGPIDMSQRAIDLSSSAEVSIDMDDDVYLDEYEWFHQWLALLEEGMWWPDEAGDCGYYVYTHEGYICSLLTDGAGKHLYAALTKNSDRMTPGLCQKEKITLCGFKIPLYNDDEFLWFPEHQRDLQFSSTPMDLTAAFKTGDQIMNMNLKHFSQMFEESVVAQKEKPIDFSMYKLHKMKIESTAVHLATNLEPCVEAADLTIKKRRESYRGSFWKHQEIKDSCTIARSTTFDLTGQYYLSQHHNPIPEIRITQADEKPSVTMCSEQKECQIIQKPHPTFSGHFVVKASDSNFFSSKPVATKVDVSVSKQLPDLATHLKKLPGTHLSPKDLSGTSQDSFTIKKSGLIQKVHRVQVDKGVVVDQQGNCSQPLQFQDIKSQAIKDDIPSFDSILELKGQRLSKPTSDSSKNSPVVGLKPLSTNYPGHYIPSFPHRQKEVLHSTVQRLNTLNLNQSISIPVNYSVKKIQKISNDVDIYQSPILLKKFAGKKIITSTLQPVTVEHPKASETQIEPPRNHSFASNMDGTTTELKEDCNFYEFVDYSCKYILPQCEENSPKFTLSSPQSVTENQLGISEMKNKQNKLHTVDSYQNMLLIENDQFCWVPMQHVKDSQHKSSPLDFSTVNGDTSITQKGSPKTYDANMLQQPFDFSKYKLKKVRMEKKGNKDDSKSYSAVDLSVDREDDDCPKWTNQPLFFSTRHIQQNHPSLSVQLGAVSHCVSQINYLDTKTVVKFSYSQKGPLNLSSTNDTFAVEKLAELTAVMDLSSPNRGMEALSHTTRWEKNESVKPAGLMKDNKDSSYPFESVINLKCKMEKQVSEQYSPCLVFTQMQSIIPLQLKAEQQMHPSSQFQTAYPAQCRGSEQQMKNESESWHTKNPITHEKISFVYKRVKDSRHSNIPLNFCKTSANTDNQNPKSSFQMMKDLNLLQKGQPMDFTTYKPKKSMLQKSQQEMRNIHKLGIEAVDLTVEKEHEYHKLTNHGRQEVLTRKETLLLYSTPRGSLEYCGPQQCQYITPNKAVQRKQCPARESVCSNTAQMQPREQIIQTETIPVTAGSCFKSPETSNVSLSSLYSVPMISPCKPAEKMLHTTAAFLTQLEQPKLEPANPQLVEMTPVDKNRSVVNTDVELHAANTNFNKERDKMGLFVNDSSSTKHSSSEKQYEKISTLHIKPMHLEQKQGSRHCRNEIIRQYSLAKQESISEDYNDTVQVSSRAKYLHQVTLDRFEKDLLFDNCAQKRLSHIPDIVLSNTGSSYDLTQSIEISGKDLSTVSEPILSSQPEVGSTPEDSFTKVATPSQQETTLGKTQFKGTASISNKIKSLECDVALSEDFALPSTKAPKSVVPQKTDETTVIDIHQSEIVFNGHSLKVVQFDESESKLFCSTVSEQPKPLEISRATDERHVSGEISIDPTLPNKITIEATLGKLMSSDQVETNFMPIKSQNKVLSPENIVPEIMGPLEMVLNKEVSAPMSQAVVNEIVQTFEAAPSKAATDVEEPPSKGLTISSVMPTNSSAYSLPYDRAAYIVESTVDADVTVSRQFMDRNKSSSEVTSEDQALIAERTQHETSVLSGKDLSLSTELLRTSVIHGLDSEELTNIPPTGFHLQSVSQENAFTDVTLPEAATISEEVTLNKVKELWAFTPHPISSKEEITCELQPFTVKSELASKEPIDVPAMEEGSVSIEFQASPQKNLSFKITLPEEAVLSEEVLPIMVNASVSKDFSHYPNVDVDGKTPFAPTEVSAPKDSPEKGLLSMFSVPQQISFQAGNSLLGGFLPASQVTKETSGSGGLFSIFSRPSTQQTPSPKGANLGRSPGTSKELPNKGIFSIFGRPTCKEAPSQRAIVHGGNAEEVSVPKEPEGKSLFSMFVGGSSQHSAFSSESSGHSSHFPGSAASKDTTGTSLFSKFSGLSSQTGPTESSMTVRGAVPGTNASNEGKGLFSIIIGSTTQTNVSKDHSNLTGKPAEVRNSNEAECACNVPLKFSQTIDLVQNTHTSRASDVGILNMPFIQGQKSELSKVQSIKTGTDVCQPSETKQDTEDILLTEKGIVQESILEKNNENHSEIIPVIGSEMLEMSNDPDWIAKFPHFSVQKVNTSVPVSIFKENGGEGELVLNSKEVLVTDRCSEGELYFAITESHPAEQPTITECIATEVLLIPEEDVTSEQVKGDVTEKYTINEIPKMEQIFEIKESPKTEQLPAIKVMEKTLATDRPPETESSLETQPFLEKEQAAIIEVSLQLEQNLEAQSSTEINSLPTNESLSLDTEPKLLTDPSTETNSQPKTDNSITTIQLFIEEKILSTEQIPTTKPENLLLRESQRSIQPEKSVFDSSVNVFSGLMYKMFPGPGAPSKPQTSFFSSAQSSFFKSSATSAGQSQQKSTSFNLPSSLPTDSLKTEIFGIFKGSELTKPAENMSSLATQPQNGVHHRNKLVRDKAVPLSTFSEYSKIAPEEQVKKVSEKSALEENIIPEDLKSSKTKGLPGVLIEELVEYDQKPVSEEPDLHLDTSQDEGESGKTARDSESMIETTEGCLLTEATFEDKTLEAEALLREPIFNIGERELHSLHKANSLIENIQQIPTASNPSVAEPPTKSMFDMPRLCTSRFGFISGGSDSGKTFATFISSSPTIAKVPQVGGSFISGFKSFSASLFQEEKPAPAKEEPPEASMRKSGFPRQSSQTSKLQSLPVTCEPRTEDITPITVDALSVTEPDKITTNDPESTDNTDTSEPKKPLEIAQSLDEVQHGMQTPKEISMVSVEVKYTLASKDECEVCISQPERLLQDRNDRNAISEPFPSSIATAGPLKMDIPQRLVKA